VLVHVTRRDVAEIPANLLHFREPQAFAIVYVGREAVREPACGDWGPPHVQKRINPYCIPQLCAGNQLVARCFVIGRAGTSTGKVL
jgi:hypothetical protein